MLVLLSSWYCLYFEALCGLARVHCRISLSCFLDVYYTVRGNWSIVALLYCVLLCLLFWVVFSLCIFLYCFDCPYQSSDWLWRMPLKGPIFVSGVSTPAVLWSVVFCREYLDQWGHWMFKEFQQNVVSFWLNVGEWWMSSQQSSLESMVRTLRSIMLISAFSRLWLGQLGSWAEHGTSETGHYNGTSCPLQSVCMWLV